VTNNFSEQPATVQPNLLRRIGKGMALAVGLVFLIIGVGWWVTYVRFTANGFHAGPADIGYVTLGFFLWLIPWLIGTLTIIAASAPRRKLVAMILLAAGAIILIVAIVTTATAAQSP
jgi:hypothetical protein